MKTLKKVWIAIAVVALLATTILAFTACDKGVDGTYTYTVQGDMGENKFTLTLSNGKDAQMDISAGPINDSYFGTYVVNEGKVEITRLYNENNENSKTPGLWNDIIDAETGNCVVVLGEDGTFTFEPTGNESALPDLPGGGDDVGANSYKFVLQGAIGTDTFTLTIKDETTVELKISNAMFTDVFTGTYTRNGNELAIKGLVGNTMMGENVHPGLFGDIINADTGDCDVVLNDTDKSFTFKPTGGQGGIPGGDIGGEDTWANGTIYTDVKYVADGTDAQTMNVYVPAEGESLPLFVMIHGGKFTMGGAEMMSDVYSYFRDKGFVCASLNYTLGEATYPQAVIDCKTAVQYLVDNADTYHIDATKIVVMGESAGSTIASLVSLSKSSDFKAEGAADYTFSVSAYVDFYGPISNGNANIGENVDGGVNAWLGEQPAVDLASYFTGMFSCKNIWIQHGDADTSVNKAHAELFKAAIDAYNENCTIPPAKISNVHFEILAGAGHMDDAFYTAENMSALYEWLCETFGISIGGGVVEADATYTYTAKSINPFTGAEMTDVFELKLLTDGTCTLGIPAGNDTVKGPFAGTYTLNGQTVVVTGLTNVPGVGYTFVKEGGFVAKLNDKNEFAPVVATYTYTAKSTNPVTGAEMTDIFHLDLYADGTCTLGVPAGSDIVKGPFAGTYTLEGTTLTVAGLQNVPGVGYTYVKDGGFSATVDGETNTFAPIVNQ